MKNSIQSYKINRKIKQLTQREGGRELTEFLGEARTEVDGGERLEIGIRRNESGERNG
jgi:hypothetical protein